MPMTVKDHLFLLSFQQDYMSQLNQNAASNALGMHTISMAEKANMLGLMQNWITAHAVGKAEEVFLEEFREFARPLHSKQGRAVLAKAAQDAARSGGNSLHAQIRAAAELREQRSNLFDWDKNKKYNAGSAAIANLEKGLEERRAAQLKGMTRPDRKSGFAEGATPIVPVSAEDVTTLATSALQACVLDALLHKHGQIRLLFTTGKLVGGTIFLRMLASSMKLYQRGFIMNPTILRENAPAASSINWDIRLNDFFLHAGIQKGAAFVFATSSVDYATFLDPATKDPATRARMMAAPVGSKVPGLKTWNDMNYPVKPGGSEILTLLEYGYDVAPQEARFHVDAKLGFVMVPGMGAAPRKERFLQMHASFTQQKFDRLIAFTQKLGALGIYH